MVVQESSSFGGVQFFEWYGICGRFVVWDGLLSISIGEEAGTMRF